MLFSSLQAEENGRYLFYRLRWC